jgi:hypothetical protein
LLEPVSARRAEEWMVKIYEDENYATIRFNSLLDLDVLNFFKERASKAGALAYQHRSIKYCAYTWKASSCGKTCEGIIGRQRKTVVPSCLILRKTGILK